MKRLEGETIRGMQGSVNGKLWVSGECQGIGRGSFRRFKLWVYVESEGE